MKSFFAIAILGAIAFADDAADKAAVALQDNHGATIGKMENAIAIDAISLKTGNAADKGTLQLTTFWRETTGTDAETYVGFQWSIAPTAAYDSASSTLALAFGKDLSENNVLYTKYARMIAGSTTYFTFNYVQLARSLTSLSAGQNALSAAETTSMGTARTLYTVKADGSISGQSTIADAKVWDVDVENSTYTPATGAQTVYLQRANAGVEEVKVGGASYVGWQFTDKDGSQNGGAYMKWADDAHDDAGAASVATFAAIAMVAALF